MFHLLLMIILGEELKATEEVILITRLFQMIKVWMPNCISHLHHHIYDHIFACSQENYKLLKKYLWKDWNFFSVKWFTRTFNYFSLRRVAD